MRTLRTFLCLAVMTGCGGPGTFPPDGADGASDGGTILPDLLPMAGCRAAQGLSGTPLPGLCVDMEKTSTEMLLGAQWNLMSQPEPGACLGWIVDGMPQALHPNMYNIAAGSYQNCGFRLPELQSSAWANKTQLRIAIEYEFQPGNPEANSLAEIELIGTSPPTIFFPTTQSSAQAPPAVFDLDVARLPATGSEPIDFFLSQTMSLSSAPTWTIRSLAVLTVP